MSKPVRIIYQVVDKATVSLGKIAAGVQGVGGATVKSSDRLIAFGGAFQETGGILGSVGSVLVGVGDKIAGLGPIAEAAAAMIVAYLAVKATQAIIGFTRDSIEAFADFEYVMADVAAKLGVTVGEIVELTDLAKEMGVKYGVGAKAAGGGLESFAAAGFNAEESAIALEEAMKLSIITGASLNESAKLIVQYLAMYGGEAKDAAEYVDALVSADLASIAAANEFGTALGYCGGSAAAFGVDIQETLGILALLTNKIGFAEKSGRYLDAMFADLMRKSDRLGFSIYDTSGKLRPLADIFGLFAYKMEGLSDEMRMAYLAEIGLTRQSARTIINLAGVGDSADDTRQKIYEMQDEINQTGVAAKAVDTKMGTLRFTMMKLDATVYNLKITIGEALAPAMTFIVEKVTDLVTGFTQFIEKLKSIGTTIDRVVNPPLEAFKVVLEGIDERLGSIQPVLDNFAESMESLGKILEEPLVGWEKFWGKFSGAAEEAAEDVKKAVEDTEKSTEPLGNMITENVEDMVKTVNEALEQGLVGDAQDAIQRFVDCSVNKSLDLHDQIRDSIYDLTVEMHERYARMVKDAEYLGGEQGAAMLLAAEDLKQGYLDKIGTLEGWQKKTLEGWLGPTLGDISDTWTSTNGDFEPLPTNFPELNYPPTPMGDITVNVGGITIESMNSDMDKDELLEDVGQTVVDALLAIGGGGVGVR